MKIKVLGASGSGASGYKSSAFLVDGFLLLDAGTAGELSAREEDSLRCVLVSHAHLDHVKGLPFLMESRVGRETDPITLMGGKEIIGDIRKHIFNNRIWPDFSKIPSAKAPVFRYKALNTSRVFKLDGYTIAMERVNHTVPAHGYIIEGPAKKALAYTGDTGPTERFWKRMEEFDVRALVTEASFPNRLEGLALSSGHLTPALLEKEIRKLSRMPETIYVMHIKPRFAREVRAEIRALGRKNLRIIESGEQFRL